MGLRGGVTRQLHPAHQVRHVRECGWLRTPPCRLGVDVHTHKSVVIVFKRANEHNFALVIVTMPIATVRGIAGSLFEELFASFPDAVFNLGEGKVG